MDPLHLIEIGEDGSPADDVEPSTLRHAALGEIKRTGAGNSTASTSSTSQNAISPLSKRPPWAIIPVQLSQQTISRSQ